jgi:hypothetical protein
MDTNIGNKMQDTIELNNNDINGYEQFETKYLRFEK